MRQDLLDHLGHARDLALLAGGEHVLAGFTAQSFNGALNRFIPQAGLRTRSFILRAYTVSAVGSGEGVGSDVATGVGVGANVP